jgi:hypothetical protein
MPSKNSLSALKGREGLSPVLPDTHRPHQVPSTAKRQAKPKVKRVNKGFQVEQGRAHKWDLLVARMKAEGINGPQLIDEALDYLFEKYDA